MSKPIFIRKNWYGFKHDEVNKNFEGGLTFLNSFTIKNEYQPVTVYKVAKPNKKKGHKKYMILQLQGASGIIRGLSVKEMNQERYQMAIHCLKCNEINFSAMHHDYTKCTCGNTSIDGGKDYTKCGWETDTKFHKIFMIDLLTGKPKPTKKEKHNIKFKKKLGKLINE